jgi:hypothetical protein
MKNYITIYLALFFSASMVAQDFTHPTSGTSNFSVTGSHNYYDSGGVGCNDGIGSYSDLETGISVFCPSVLGDPVTIEFLDVDLETSGGIGPFAGGACYDALSIYNGNSTGDPLLFEGCGEEGFDVCASGNPGDGGDAGVSEGGPNDINASASGVPSNVNNIWTSTNANGCLTVSFTTDGSVREGGWVATVTRGLICGPTYTFIGGNPTNPSDPTLADNWMNDCIPPPNDPTNVIIIQSNQTLIGTQGLSLSGSVTNNGTISGPITIDGDVTNNGIIAP